MRVNVILRKLIMVSLLTIGFVVFSYYFWPEIDSLNESVASRTLTKNSTETRVPPVRMLNKNRTKTPVKPVRTLNKNRTKTLVEPVRTMNKNRTKASVKPVRTLNKNRTKKLVKNQILIYTKHYFSSWSDAITGEPIFQDKRCIYTFDHNDLMTSEWVLFNHRDVRTFSDLPKKKFLNQKWILYNVESPMGNRRYDDMRLFRNITHYFDVTMNYRMDSDIPIPYGMIKKNTASTNTSFKIDFQRKTKQIAWFVSNCISFSRREEIAKKLGQHIPIDIYGSCGKLTCSKKEACYRMLSRDYKFYLSFENSLCTDYVTEKLFNVMSYGIIPIVYGGANYSQILPANSYIDVRNFTSSVQLADYLNYVGNNEAVYKSYFDWRKDYHSETNIKDTLCDRLLSDSVRPDANRDIYKWWLYGTCESVDNLCWTE